LNRGLSFELTIGNIVGPFPPLIVTLPQLDQAIDLLDSSLAELESRMYGATASSG
jgi:hypothetical protein